MRATTVITPLVVSREGNTGPYITVSTDQLDSVLEALRAQDVPVQVEKDAVLLKYNYSLSVVNLGLGADVPRIQGILDQVAAKLRAARAARNGVVAMTQELLVRCDPGELPVLMERMESKPPDGWKRLVGAEDDLGTSRILARSICFTKKIETIGREVAVWLRGHEPNELSLWNLISLHTEALATEQYQDAVADFRKTFIEPSVDGFNVRVFSYWMPFEPPLEHLLSYDAMNRLTGFSSTVNRNNLSPRDIYRWRGIVSRIHLDDTVLSSELLSTWLEDQGWPPEPRERLVSEYDCGRDLLTVFEDERIADEDHRRSRR